MPLCLMTCNVMMSVGIPCHQVSLVVSGSSFWFDELGSNPAVITGGALEKPSPVGCFDWYQRFMRCRNSSARCGI